MPISPNPASEYIEIKQPSEGFEPSEGSAIKIYNTFGECVMTVGATAVRPYKELIFRICLLAFISFKLGIIRKNLWW